MQKVFCYILLSSLNLFGLSSVCAADKGSSTSEIHAQANDLKYGSVLYELYQGYAFEALSALNVAKVKGGIIGHNSHPALIEGSLMLTYGMTQEAKLLFESLLLDETNVDHEIVSEDSRNQAWFYLGKVLMLEQNFNASMEALEHVDSNLLQESHPEIFNEWLYLKALIAGELRSGITKKIEPSLSSSQINDAVASAKQAKKPKKFYNWLYEKGEISKEAVALLSHDDAFIWQAYFRYNLAANMLNEVRYDTAKILFNTLISDISQWLVSDETNNVELLALKDQALLSLGQLHIVLDDYEQALITLKRIRIDSVFSDQALFTYAVAASHLEKFGLALQALNTLKDRELFSPWRQQTPYALAYLYEQLGEPELALEAYNAAVSHYENLAIKLDKNQSEVTEEKVLNALSLQESSIEQDMLSELEIPLALGRNRVANDEYGYLQVDPSDFNYAELLATEPFQLSLRDLHELYKLKFSLSRWESQLDSFDAMMNTRKALRTKRIDETLSVMSAQNSEQWIKQQQAFLLEFESESGAENSVFFMDENQREYFSIIQRMTKNLAYLPEGEEKDNFALKLKRMQAHFTWWIDDLYSVNRWASKKQLNGLTRAVEEFKQRNAALKKHISSDEVNRQLLERIIDGRARLSTLKLALEKNLSQASADLLALVQVELGRQREEAQRYLLGASKAQARLADTLFLTSPDETESSIQNENDLMEDAK